MTNEHIINPAHSIMTLFIALSVISYILQVGYAKPLHCIHNIICDSPNEYCDPVGEDCVSCSRVCPQGTEYCQRLCPDYYHIHFNISTTQEPAIEEVTSAVPHHNAKVPRNAEENTTLPPESNNTVLTVVLSIVGSLLVIIVLVVGILVFLCKRHQQSPTNHEDGEGQQSAFASSAASASSGGGLEMIGQHARDDTQDETSPFLTGTGRTQDSHAKAEPDDTSSQSGSLSLGSTTAQGQPVGHPESQSSSSDAEQNAGRGRDEIQEDDEEVLDRTQEGSHSTVTARGHTVHHPTSQASSNNESSPYVRHSTSAARFQQGYASENSQQHGEMSLREDAQFIDVIDNIHSREPPNPTGGGEHEDDSIQVNPDSLPLSLHVPGSASSFYQQPHEANQYHNGPASVASYQTDRSVDLGGGGMRAEREAPAEHGLESLASYHTDCSVDLGGQNLTE